MGAVSLTRRIAFSVVCVVGVVCTATAAELARYREFELGSSVAAVTAVTHTTDRDLKTVHSRPALLQDVLWQPRYTIGAPVADRSSINEIAFNFVDDRLFRMTVTYDRARTSRLTNADMVSALSDLFGTANTPTAQTRASADAAGGVTVLAEWQQADTHVMLRRSAYNESFSMVITSMPLEAIARKARTTALALDAREAPAREAALAKKRADDLRQAEEQERTANKKVFKP